ncbi:MAG: hypothetical protein ACRBN8_39760 [Nannocystales bacterium]
MLERVTALAIVFSALACGGKPVEPPVASAESHASPAVLAATNVSLTSFHVGMWCPPVPPGMEPPPNGELPVNMRQANPCVSSYIELALVDCPEGAVVAVTAVRLLDDGKPVSELTAEDRSIQIDPTTYAGWDGVVPPQSEFTAMFTLAKVDGTSRSIDLLPKGGGDSFSIEIDVAIDGAVQRLRSKQFSSP